MHDEDIMRRAIAIARQNPDVPIGCVIVLDGKIAGDGHNVVEQDYDPTAHAEIVAIRRACEAVGGVLDADCAALYYGPDDHPPAQEQGNS